MKKLITIIILLFAMIQVNAQEESQTEKKGFTIIYACKDYNLAKRVANEANKHLGYEINLRGLEYNKTEGLSLSEDECKENNFEFPSYIQRGRAKDGNFISVEYTNAYNDFTPNYYIVVVASYTKGKEEIKSTLQFVKKHYEDAYVKYTDVYMGCIH